MHVPNSLSNDGKLVLHSWMTLARHAYMVTTVLDSRRDWTSGHWKQRVHASSIPPRPRIFRLIYSAIWAAFGSTLPNAKGSTLLPGSTFLHLTGFKPSSSCKMQILLKNPSDQICSLALLNFQIKEQPQHPPSSSLLFTSWQKVNAYIFPRTLVSVPRTCHDSIFNSVFSSLPFFVEEPWNPSYFFFICAHICFALPFLTPLDKRPWSDSSQEPNVPCTELCRNTSSD